MSFNHWLTQRIEKTKQAGLYRGVRTMSSAAQPKMVVNGAEQIVFSSNNYLGLANDPILVEKAVNTLQEFGLGSSGSRLTTGNTEWHEKLEQRIASFKKSEAALLFSSGYLANIGVLSSLPEKGDVLLSDQLNHASIIDGCRLSKAETVIYQHTDMNSLELKLKETQAYTRRFIVTDGVFSMDGTIAPLVQIMKLANRYDAYVIVDDAHATGVLGEEGKGTSEHFGVSPDVIIGTLSKAIGVEGGFVTGSRVLVDFLLNHARTFIFQTAIPPVSCAAAYAAIDMIEKDKEKRKHLLRMIKVIKGNLDAMGFIVYGQDTPIIPVIIGDAETSVQFSKKLQENGIYAPAIRPPTVTDGKSRIRLTVTAAHTDSQIEHLLTSFKYIGRELEIIS
ncbi:8-amino-7-oxononanoate synthase [Metabacillus bambusae]|uniref:8-amino-7-ketopelargonate synthase n=1 Tax=Metabacillus bambusae TaxID=2795218 RepID=A0ABS3MZE6_9BACI|nr:8-amino-7-oxononanoate synthase [Metabacillus bambusae]MBO1511211.1 8-amino-7-oxononanoate synthase [Metabacillus bambusae]